MDEPTELVTPAVIAVSAVTAAVGMFKWLLGREVERHSEHMETTKSHGKRIEELERQTVTKSDLDRTETRLTSAIGQAVGQIATAVGEAKQSANAAHERIDHLRDK
jgi:hypothetical protein